MILITGATGNVGAEVVRKLAENKQPTRAFVRNRTQAGEIALPGVEIVEGDFAKPKTFARALEGVATLFLLTPSSAEAEEWQCNFVDAAQKSKVKHIVKLSQLGANANAPGRFHRYHGAVENYIVKSKIAYTFLRPNLFMQGLLKFRPTIASQGVFFAPVSQARISVVDVRDIGAVAAKTLTEPKHEGKVYELTGPEALTHGEMAEQLSQAVGKMIKHAEVLPAVMKEALLKNGVPAWQAEGIMEDYESYRKGEGETVTTTIRDITGYEATFFAQFSLDNAARFAGKAATKT
jgi:uncharacterized protein YbjT (DUF2867 family)